MLGASLSDILYRKRRLPTDEIPNVPEGDMTMAREVIEYHRLLFEEAAAGHRREAEGLLQAETAGVATQTLSHMNARYYRLENNFAAEFDERQRISLHEFSVESAQALEAQREVLTHEAA